jgi:hypothetical protein
MSAKGRKRVFDYRYPRSFERLGVGGRHLPSMMDLLGPQLRQARLNGLLG